MAKVLVTGSAGTVGRPLCEELGRRGHVVRALDVAPTPEVADAVIGDVADAAAVQAAMTGVDVVVHLAAQPHERPFPELVGPNVIGLYNVMDAAREQAVKRVVLASSMMVVWGGRGPEGPVGVGERRPNNHYALTKVWAEQMGELYARRFGMSVLAVRLGWMVRTPDEARHMTELGIFDCYVSRADGARALAAAVEAEGISFEIVYAASRGGERVFDMEPARRLLGFEASSAGQRASRFHCLMDSRNRGPLTRLLALAWDYRAVCLRVFVGQLAALALGLGALAGSGLAVDVVRRAVDPAAPPVRWLFAIAPPASWSPARMLIAVVATALLLATLRARVVYGTALATGHADEIVVLDHGRIVERGTHAALLAANGAYARTFRRAAGVPEGT